MMLTSWKEIASHLNCAVRTAQRWERHGLPVRRPIPGRWGMLPLIAKCLSHGSATVFSGAEMTSPISPRSNGRERFALRRGIQGTYCEQTWLRCGDERNYCNTISSRCKHVPATKSGRCLSGKVDQRKIATSLEIPVKRRKLDTSSAHCSL